MSEKLLTATVWVTRPDSDERKAELLHRRVRKGQVEFYVHYEGFNKRLDEWIPETRLLLDKEITYPKPEGSSTPKPGQKEKKAPSEEAAEKEESEIEKLRTSGSMVQQHHEVARVRNISKVIFGEYQIEPWYFSPYPQEMTEEDQIYICEFSLQYFSSLKQFERFRKKYTLRHPPGNEIYRDEKFSFYEIDGRLQRTWCRNLCLFSKLFLDHKTLYYDVDPFMFYCMTKRDEYGDHLVGYFSKEKESSEGYNVACILSLPQYQRFGYGKVLIDFSYNLSKKEKKQGSPEKPLSDLGLISYRSFWSDVLIETLIEGGNAEITVDELCQMTSFTSQDIIHTLQALNMFKYHRGQHIICLTDEAVERYEKRKAQKKHRIDPEKLKWKPPVFTQAQLKFGW